MNRDHLLAEAKKEVLHMLATGWHPPAPEKIYAGGRDLLAALRSRAAYVPPGRLYHRIRDRDRREGDLCDGWRRTQPTAWVDEQYILDLEREAFMSLSGEEKTQERMYAILDTGRPLRN